MTTTMKCIPAILVMSLFAGTALAKQTENVHVAVSAKINTEEFQVAVPDPSDNWLADGVVLSRAATSPNLNTVTKQLYLKSTTGAISARLLSAAVLTSGANSIALAVAVNTKALSTSSAEVLTAAAALTGSTVPVEISAAAAPSGGYVAGDYNGTINMIFETDAP